MSANLDTLLPPVVRRLARLTGLPIAGSDLRGRVIAATAPDSHFCPLVARSEAVAPPLPARCEGCARITDFLALGDRLAPCPRGADVVRPILVSGQPVGWLSTGITAGAKARSMAAVEEQMDLVALLLAASVASEARQELMGRVLSQRLLGARIRVDEGIARAAEGDSPEPSLRLAREELDRASDGLLAFRQAAPTATAALPDEPDGEPADDAARASQCASFPSSRRRAPSKERGEARA